MGRPRVEWRINRWDWRYCMDLMGTVMGNEEIERIRFDGVIHYEYGNHIQ